MPDEEDDFSRTPEITVGVVLCWAMVLSGCVGLMAVGGVRGGVVGGSVAAVAGAAGVLLSAGVWLRWFRVVLWVSGLWTAACGLGVMVSPGIAIFVVDVLTPSSRSGFQWGGPAEAFLGVVGTLVVLGVGLGCGAGLYVWADRCRALSPRNLCPTCGYDLRATPSAWGPLLERCPECGWKP